MIDNLVLNEKRRNLLVALSKGFMQDDALRTESGLPHEPWKADFMKGKGNSQIFLLHGPPGVGKTYTAECIAETTGRPLMTLNSSDIGIHPETIERNLEDSFKLAKRWNAILLIDEADIYLERRSLRDIKRNSLVAGKTAVNTTYARILTCY